MSEHDKNIGQLAREAANDLSSIARNEFRLAAAELQENMNRATRGFGETLTGVALLIPAATVALIAAGFGLATIDGLSEWAAFLIVAAVAGIAGFLLMKAGKDSLDPAKLFPKRTADNLRRDARTVSDVRAMKDAAA